MTAGSQDGHHDFAGRANVVDVEPVDALPITPLDTATLRRYLGLEYEFSEFVSRFAGDPCIGPALTGWPGLRVLRQDRWECLVAFICSSTSNIPRIKRDVNLIAASFGDRIGPGPRDFAFPSASRLADAGEARLRELGLGFRAKSVARAAAAVGAGALNLEAASCLPYREALEVLTGLYGVGEKIADCVLAFAFDMPEAFPVDRWVKRALEEWYGLPATLNNEKAAAWARAKFGRDAAYVNQYLFHRQRLTAHRVILPTVG
jgi:N-glycosylase/DNA lyase